jgi:hemolysin activation/secretion protein
MALDQFYGARTATAAAFVAIIAGALGSAATHAQTVPIVPQGSPIPRVAPPQPPRVGPGLSTAPPPSVSTSGQVGQVTVRSVRIEGATAFPEARLLAEAGGPLTGPAVPVTNLEAARAAILALYRNEGYVFSTVDAVLSPDGGLRLVVGEGQITEVQLDGDIGPAGTQVLRFLEQLKAARPLDIATLERWLLLAQDIPGVSLRTLLRPAGTAPGSLVLVARVSRRPVSGFVTADNRAFRLTGPEQALGVVQLNSFTQFAERTEISLLYGAQSTQLFGQIASEFYLGGSGLRMRLYGGRGEARPSGVLNAIGYEGTTTVAGVSLSYPVLRRRAYSLNVVAGFDLLDSEITIGNGSGGDVRVSRDQLRVLRLGAEGAIYDLLLGASRPASNTLQVRLSHGLDAFGATGSNDRDAGRQGFEPAFTSFAFDATRVQTLFSPWDGATVALQGTLAGQWSDDVLPLAERFFLGGARLGRGFYAGEVTGDRALAGSLELQLGFSYEQTLLSRSVRLAPLFYVFHDRGRTWENRAADPDRRIASSGVGIRLGIDELAELQVEGVRRETRRPDGNTAALHEDAIYWRVLARF